MIIYHPFIEYGQSGSNDQHSMLYFCKDNSTVPYNKSQENISSNYVRIYDNSEQFCHCYLYGSYIQHQMSASPFTFRVMFYTTKTIKQLPTFMLSFFPSN